MLLFIHCILCYLLCELGCLVFAVRCGSMYPYQFSNQLDKCGCLCSVSQPHNPMGRSATCHGGIS